MPNQEFIVKRIAWDDAEFQSAKDAEFRLFGVANGFASCEDLAAGEMLIYRPYERKSEFYIAYDRYARSPGPVGIIRFIRFDPDRKCDSFSTLKDARSYSVRSVAPACYLYPKWDSFFRAEDPSTIGELATQAVIPAYRRCGAVENIWDTMIDASEREGVFMWTTALVVPLYRWYKRILPNAIHAIGRVMPQYVGADSIPALVRIDHPEVRHYQRQFRSGRWHCIPGRLGRTARARAVERRI